MAKKLSIRFAKDFVKSKPSLATSIIRLIIFLKFGFIRSSFHWLLSGHLVRYFRIRQWLYNNDERYLQVGGGAHLKLQRGWLNGDIIAGDIYLDASQKLPFKNDTLDVIFTEQFIEHLNQDEANFFMKEAHRVLKPGGKIRQSTPDLGLLVAIYEDRNQSVSLIDVIGRHTRNHKMYNQNSRSTACQFFNDMFRLWGHQYIYDKQELELLLSEAGFVDFEWVSFGHSEDFNLMGLERHSDEDWMKEGLVMICEATKNKVALD